LTFGDSDKQRFFKSAGEAQLLITTYIQNKRHGSQNYQIAILNIEKPYIK
jgi:hypothetical protein